MQYLYLIKCQEYYKIGVAVDVENRLAQLSTGNPYPLSVEIVYRFDNAEIVERAIHQKYKDKRVRGEWFALSFDDTNELHKLCLMLGGSAFEYKGGFVGDEEIEEAEDEAEFLQYKPTLDDVKKIQQDTRYRLEYRYRDSELRGFAWRLRSGGKDCVLYVGNSNPDFEKIREILPERQFAPVSKG